MLRSHVYLIGFAVLLQRFRAPCQVFFPQGPHTKEGVPMCVMRPFNIPRFLPRFKQKLALTGQAPRKALAPSTCNYLLSYETDS
jgi:hypothetical protein